MDDDNRIICPVSFFFGRYAKLDLPRDLTKEEAEKIARVVVALAVPNGDHNDLFFKVVAVLIVLAVLWAALGAMLGISRQIWLL